MSKVCECGGSVKRGVLGSECRVCGLIVDGVRSSAPCAHGERVAGINRCKVTGDAASQVYAHLASHSCSMDARCPSFTKSESFHREAQQGQPMEFCVYQDDAGMCVQPVYEMGSDGLFILTSHEDVVLGKCPFRGDFAAQRDCAVSKPDPSLPPRTFFPSDMIPRVASKVIAHWTDVRDKGVRIRKEGRVKILRNDSEFITAEVRGDNGSYTCEIQRQAPNSWAVSYSTCTCGWGEWQWKRKQTYVGRMCFPPDQMVNMADGSYKPISEVQVGDEVLSNSGVGVVKNVWENDYSGDVVTIQTHGSPFALTATADHNLLFNGEWDSAVQGYDNTKRRKYSTSNRGSRAWNALRRGSWTDRKPAGEIEAGHYLLRTRVTEERDSTIIAESLHPRLVSDGVRVRFDADDLPARNPSGTIPSTVSLSSSLMFVCGWYLAEGSIENNGTVVAWCLSSNETEVAREIQEALAEMGVHGVRSYSPKDRNCLVVKVSNKPLVILLEHLCGKGSKTKSLSKEMMLAPIKAQRVFLDAYHQGDGHLDENGVRVISTASDVLSRQVAQVASRVVGVPAAIHRQANSPAPRERASGLSRSDAGLMINCIKFGQKYAQRRVQLDAGKVAAEVREVSRGCYHGKVYNLEVEGDHTYAVEDVLVHNCSHLYATLMEAQSQKMTGPGTDLWQHKYEASAPSDGCTYCGAGSEPVCASCKNDMLHEAALDALLNGFDGESMRFIEAALGDQAEDFILNFTDASAPKVGGCEVEVRFKDQSGRFAQVAFSDGTTNLVSVDSIEHTAQVITQSFKDEVLSAVSKEVGGEVSGITVRFSEHWSRRVVGEFSYDNALWDYEYTQSTRRVMVNKRGLPQVEVDGYNGNVEKTATRSFSYSEQQALQGESLGQTARNVSEANIEGTHYRLPSEDDLPQGYERLFI